MTAVNPFLALKALLDPSGYPAAAEGSHTGLARHFLEHPVTTFCVISIGVSLLLIALSTLTVRLGGIAGAGGLIGRDGSRSRKSKPQDPTGMREGQNEAHRGPKTVWHNPIAWREAAGRNATWGRIVARYAFIASGFVWGAIVLWFFHIGSWNAAIFRQVLTATVIGELVVTTLVAINMAATSVSKEREDGTLDLLLTTPITPGQYLSGKLKGMVAHLLPLISVPVFTIGIAGLYVLFGGFGARAGWR